jgi:hypothetical protein
LRHLEFRENAASAVQQFTKAAGGHDWKVVRPLGGIEAGASDFADRQILDQSNAESQGYKSPSQELFHK